MERHGMNGLMMAGAGLLALGVLGMAIPLFSMQQTTDVAKVGGLKLQTTESTTYAVPSLLSGGSLALGVVLIGAGLYQRR